MDPTTILADVQLAISLGKLAFELGQDAGPFLVQAYNIAFGNKQLTDDERAAMAAREQQFRSDIANAIAADDAGGSN